MQTGEDAPQAEPSAKAGPGSASAAPGLEEALRGLGEEGRAGLKAATDVAKALRILIAADDDWQTDGNPGLTKAGEAATKSV